MEPVLLGLAAPSAISEAGNLLERTLHTVAEPFSTVLHAVAEALSARSEEPAVVEADDLQLRLEKLQASLAGNIQQALASAGVELIEPLALRVSKIDGSLEVVGEHPQRTLIESALADDPELVLSFSEVVALRQLLNTAEEVDQEPAQNVALGQAKFEVEIAALFSVNNDTAKLEFN